MALPGQISKKKGPWKDKWTNKTAEQNVMKKEKFRKVHPLNIELAEYWEKTLDDKTSKNGHSIAMTRLCAELATICRQDYVNGPRPRSDKSS